MEYIKTIEIMKIAMSNNDKDNETEISTLIVDIVNNQYIDEEGIVKVLEALKSRLEEDTYNTLTYRISEED